MVQAVTDRPNITGHIAYHTFSGVHLRPYAGRPDDEFPTADLRAYTLIGERGTELTGYPAVSVFHDFKYEPKQTIKGGAHDWMYDHLGVFSWTTEFWSPQRQAGLSDYHFTDWIREHPVEDDLKLIEWAKKNYPDAYVDWYEFDHPELGKVELGGWDIINYWFNVPVRPARGRSRAALRLGALPPADLTAARGALTRRREARRELVPGAARPAELRLAPDERDRERRLNEVRCAASRSSSICPRARDWWAARRRPTSAS